MPQKRKRSAVEIFEQQTRKPSAVEIFEQTQPSAPTPTTPTGPAPGFLENLATGAKQGFVDYIANPALAASEALASLTTGNVEPAKQLLELAGRGAFQTFTEPLVKDQPSVSDQSQQIAAIREQQAKRRAQIPTFQTAGRVSQELEQRAAADPSLSGKITRGVAAGAIGAVPVVGAGLVSGGSIPAMAATAAAQSAAQPENLALNVGASVVPVPVGKLVAPILRRIRGVKAVPEIPGLAPETPLPAPSLAKAIGQDAFDDTKVALDELGLPHVPQPTRPQGAFPVQREIPVDSITLSRDNLSRGRMYQAQEGLKQGIKAEGETFTTLGGKPRRVDAIQVVPDPQNPGRFIVEGDGNHRIALLKLQGNNQLIPVKSFETPAQSGAVEQAVADLTEGYYRPPMELPTLGEGEIRPFEIRASFAERKRLPGAVGPRITEQGFIAGQNPGVVTAAERTPILETISALRKAGLLTGVKTHLKNLGGNLGFALSEEAARIPAAIADIVVSPITGRRTITGPSFGAVGRSAYEAATKGVREAWEIIKKGVSDADAARLELKELNSGSKILDTYVKGVFRTLNAEDKIFRTYAYRRALEDRARSITLTEIRSGQIPKGQYGQRVRELVDQPPADLEAAAIADAEIATFTEPNRLASGITQLKEALPQYGKFGADLLLPFVKTPTNVIKRIIEYSGGGFGKSAYLAAKGIVKRSMTEAEQRAFAQSFGRASIGSGLIALGAKLYADGLMTGFREDDPARAARDEAAGRIPGSILLGDNWHQIVGLAPLGNLLVIGATIQREANQERETGLKALTEAGSQAIGEQPLLIGAQQIASALKQPGSFVSKTLGGIAGSFVPTMAADIATTFDTAQRQATTLPSRVQTRIPGLRNLLPERPDVLGRSVPLPFAFDPTRTTEAQQQTNPLFQELVRLDQGISGFTKQKDESDELHAQKVQAFGQLYSQYGLGLINSSPYRSADDTTKKELVKLLNTRVKSLITEGQERYAQASLSPALLIQSIREASLRKQQKARQPR